MEQVKLLSMTFILTALVWASADTLVTETTTVKVRIELQEPDDVIKFSNQQEQRSVSVTLAAASKTIEFLRNEAPIAVRLTANVEQTGKVNLFVDPTQLKRSMEEAYPDLDRIAISRIEPPTIEVTVDRLVKRQVRFTTDTLTMSYDAPPLITPKTEYLWLHESLVDSLPEADESLSVDISEDVDRLFRDSPQGTEQDRVLQLDTREFGEHAYFDTPNINIKATLSPQEITQVLETVPVLLAVSFDNFDRAYKPFEPDGAPMQIVTTKITVKGPPAEVASLVRGDTRAFGVIRLKEDDLNSLATASGFEPEFYLPRGIELVGKPDTIEFRLEEVVRTETTP
ncbi:MAG: hypothetical protein ACPGXK_12285 [Phycisphaerae bacterium]